MAHNESLGESKKLQEISSHLSGRSLMHPLENDIDEERRQYKSVENGIWVKFLLLLGRINQLIDSGMVDYPLYSASPR